MSKEIHIIAFDNPFPPNYGGVIDIFYKIKALHTLGIKITLHCFLYAGKAPQTKLEQYCTKVYYYERRRYRNPFIGDIPYIVATRDSTELLQNLLKNKAPILFEGLHTTYFLNHPKLDTRIKIVRTHNVEHHYYHALESVESNFFKKYFFRVEADRLEKYENILNYATHIAAISPLETAYYKEKFKQTFYLPAFHSNEDLQCEIGSGKFVLYHGNLGVGENNKAAIYLVTEIFSQLRMPCIIAGNNASRPLEQIIKNWPHIKLIQNINSDEILHLVKQAHINVLVTFQNTGIKLKLLNALHLGRHCVCNDLMTENTGLEKLCHTFSMPQEMIEGINNLWQNDFNTDEIETRKNILKQDFCNEENAKLIAEVI